MANFGPKPWTNPFGKNNLNFWIFQTSCFCSLESRFSVLEYRKTHFPSLYCQKKKSSKNGQFWTKTMDYPFGKISIFRLFKLCAFIAQKVVLRFQNIVKHIFLAYIAKRKKVQKMANFGPKPWTNPFGKNNLNFWIFQTSCFCSLESRFSVLE